MSDQPFIVSLKKTLRPPVEHDAPVRPPRPHWPRIIAAICVLGAIGGGVWYWYSRAPEVSSNVQTETAQAEAEEEIANVIERVARLIDLPQGEEPTVATVSDPDKLADQPFFANAKTGDVVLLYTKAKKAFLYDPKRDKLIEVAPITTE